MKQEEVIYVDVVTITLKDKKEDEVEGEMTAEQYESLGLPIPKELQEGYSEEVNYETSYSSAFLDKTEISTVISNPESEGSTIYLKSNLEISVKQSIKELKTLLKLK